MTVTTDPALSRTLILVKHAMPVVESDVPAARWRLSDDGRAACLSLAERLAVYAPVAIVASNEPKATETGRIMSDCLELPFETAPDLHEHDRTDVPFLQAAAWRDAIRRFFAAPDQLVLGREAAKTAGDRFIRAVATVLDRHPTGNLAIVAHGTVISLFVARHSPVEPFALWEQLGLPSFVVLGASDFGLREMVATIT